MKCDPEGKQVDCCQQLCILFLQVGELETEVELEQRKKEKPKDIEMPAMPKSSDFDETEASSAGALDTLPEIAGENKLPQRFIDCFRYLIVCLHS